MSEKSTRTITIKFINNKPKYPKYSNGSVKLTDETWLSISKAVELNKFAVGQTYEVEVDTNDKGYGSIVAVKEAVSSPTTTASAAHIVIDDVDKNLRIARQGTLQALIQSYGLTTAPDKLFDVIIPMANRAVDYIRTGK